MALSDRTKSYQAAAPVHKTIAALVSHVCQLHETKAHELHYTYFNTAGSAMFFGQAGRSEVYEMCGRCSKTYLLAGGTGNIQQLSFLCWIVCSLKDDLREGVQS